MGTSIRLERYVVAILFAAALNSGCFPDPPECGTGIACPPSDDPCMASTCVDRHCVERPVDDVRCNLSDALVDANDAEVEGETQDSEASGELVLDGSEVDTGAASEVDAEESDSDAADDLETSEDVDAIDADAADADAREVIVVSCEGEGKPCEGVGVCGPGLVECDGEDAPRCSTLPGGSESEASVELCDELDNDCDGETDEDFLEGGSITLEDALYFADDGKVKGEECGVGECALGKVVCADALDGLVCSSDVDAGANDPCNDRDDDCDGTSDDDFVTPGSPTFMPLGGAAFAGDDGKAKGEPCGAGECASDGVNGVVACAANGARLVCTTDERTTSEKCDDLDNDCDGIAEDPFLSATGTPLQSAKFAGDTGSVKGDSCGTGLCVGGHVACAANKTSLVCDSDSNAGSEICDSLDNDCDGATDPQFKYGGVPVAQACDGVGGCGPGVVVCAVGSMTTATCSTNPNGPGSQATTEACDGIDNDCDATTDEGFTYLGTSIGADCNGVGECGVGQVSCGSEGTATCSTNPDGAAPQAIMEACGDNKDNDCDASTDEGCGPVCDPACQHGGLCTGTNTCSCTGTGYSGSVCATPVCSPTCVNGNCIGPNVCSCSPGYEGPRCDVPVCSPACAHGTCSAPNTCSCTGSGYTGTRCETPVCSPTCINGTCSAPNQCDCTGSGYSDFRCSSAVCTPDCMNGGGCISPGVCECSGYSGPRCETPICSPACNSGGVCSAPNTCSCSGGYSGPTCSVLAGYTKVSAGTFSMGSPPAEVGRDAGELQHSVTISRAFWTKTTEVTRSEWQALMGNAPSSTAGCSQCPVDQVNWFEAVAYANALSALLGAPPCYALSGCTGTPGATTPVYQCASATFAGLTCSGYRLPTEAEWEYAARAGTTTATYNGNITQTGSGAEPLLDPIAWYIANGSNVPHSVASKLSNAWGLYDMLGNVIEWIHDQTSVYGAGAVVDPTGLGGFGNRYRGGAWGTTAADTRAATRLDTDPATMRSPGLGFRPVRTSP